MLYISCSIFQAMRNDATFGHFKICIWKYNKYHIRWLIFTSIRFICRIDNDSYILFSFREYLFKALLKNEQWSINKFEYPIWYLSIRFCGNYLWSFDCDRYSMYHYWTYEPKISIKNMKMIINKKIICLLFNKNLKFDEKIVNMYT